MTGGATASGQGAATPGERIAALDGVRGLAILVVIAHNAGGLHGPRDSIALTAWAVLTTAGWAGVQLFFALSGFLITRILLEAKGTPGYFGTFYARRALRIAPIYYLYIAFVFFIVPHVGALSELEVAEPTRAVWYWTYLSNWLTAFESIPPAFGHLWSLAVEEQFYLLWPFVVAMCVDRTLIKVCLAIVVAAVITRLGVYEIFPRPATAAYAITLARGNAIALGALVAIVHRDARLWRMIAPHAGFGVAACLVGMAGVVAIERGLHPIGRGAELAGQPLTAFCSAFVVMACVYGEALPRPGAIPRLLTRTMSMNWLRTAGKYSYAMYVFQTPVRILLLSAAGTMLATGSSNERLLKVIAFVAVTTAVSFLLALISWKLIEAPILSLKRHFPAHVPERMRRAA